MKSNKIYLVITIFSLFTVISCSNDEIDKDTDVIYVESEQKTDFDKYLEKNFTEPYNVRFMYKWDGKASDMNYDLVPAGYENSVKMAHLVKYLCLDSYDAVAPKNFLKEYFPKEIMLVGSAAYRNNGTMVLGTAEGGAKITLYNINNLDTNNIEKLYIYYFRTIFHEFSHILHQNKLYTKDFERICEKDYTGDVWNEVWGNKKGGSLAKGFISDYSSKDSNEDFVELIAHYVTYTPEKWEETLNKAGEEGKQKLLQKIGIVKQYLLKDWSINIDKLRQEVNTRADNLQNIDLMDISIK